MVCHNTLNRNASGLIQSGIIATLLAFGVDQAFQILKVGIAEPLIFDEVGTGFKLALGGAQEYYGVTPDLATFGKGLGSGYPIGAVAGSDEIMSYLDPASPDDERIFSLGSFHGNAVSTAAAVATIKGLREPGIYEHLTSYGNRLRETWRFTVGSRTPLLGNRGPKDGVENLDSWTYGRNGKWAGQIVFGDGHVEFVETFTVNGIFFESGGQYLLDNFFRMEQGADGLDVILSFTQEMTEDGPVLQFD